MAPIREHERCPETGASCRAQQVGIDERISKHTLIARSGERQGGAHDASEHHPGRNGVARYLEGRLVGHQWYTTIGRDPLFPFGFGLGYACASIDAAAAPSAHEVVVTLSNAGTRDAVEVVEVYAHLVVRDDVPRDEPDQRLVGFAKVHVAAGTTVETRIALDRHAYRTWDVLHARWVQRTDLHELRIGRSAAEIVYRIEVRP